MNELSVIVNSNPSTINFNFDELKSKAQGLANTYSNIVITEDTYKSAKADAKILGGYIKDIEEKRKETKKILEIPIKEFEGKCKELEGIINTAKEKIENQTDIYDNNRRIEKKKKAQEYIDLSVKKYGLMPEYVNKISMKDFYTNLTTTFKSVQADIDEQVLALKNEQDVYNSVINTATEVIKVVNDKIENKIVIDDMSRKIDNIMNLYRNNNLTLSPEEMISNEIKSTADKIFEWEEIIRKKTEERIRQEQEKKQQDLLRKEQERQDLLRQQNSANQQGSSEQQNSDDDFVFVAQTTEPSKDISETPDKGSKWFMTIELTGYNKDLKEIGNILKEACSSNNVSYNVRNDLCKKI